MAVAFVWLNMSHCDTNTRAHWMDDEQGEALSRFRSLDWPKQAVAIAPQRHQHDARENSLRRGSYVPFANPPGTVADRRGAINNSQRL